MNISTPVASDDDVKASVFSLGSILLLMVANALSMADRQIVGILAEPIKKDLGISDAQIGLLIGLSFALFYATFGLILSRVLDRHNRSVVMAICLMGWSLATAACGLARNYWTMLAMRVGVAVGEASCLPAAQSMIADYVPMRRRASAMSILVAGSPLGVLIGMALGGIVSANYGWRVAFFVAGVPGVLVALLIWRFVPDPDRQKLSLQSRQHLSFLAALSELKRIPSFWFITAATGFIAFGIYSQSAFLASFYIRNHGAEIEAVAGGLGTTGFVGMMLGLILGLGGAIGTLFGGRVADWICRGQIRHFMTMAMIVSVVSVPFFVSAVMVEGFYVSIAFLIPATVVSFFYSGPSYAASVSLVPTEIRATASALTLLMVNLIGLGLGPVTVGLLSDHFAVAHGPAEGLRMALSLSPIAAFVAVVLFFLARRNLPGNLDGDETSRPA